jgi:hypothetical protein
VQLHWLGLKDAAPERYTIYKGRLMRTRQPGFVVQGFLCCGSRDEPQYHEDNKRVKPLDGTWPDKAMQDIVSAACSAWWLVQGSIQLVMRPTSKHTLSKVQLCCSCFRDC